MQDIRARVEFNRYAREQATQVVGLINDCLKEIHEDSRDVFSQLVFNAIAPFMQFPASRNRELPMTDEQARRFGNEPMPYGEFKGVRVDNVALERLLWYADQHFTDDLRRYVLSRRIKAESENFFDE